MDTKKLDILQAVYFDCIQDRDEEKQIIQNNLSRIQEINTFYSLWMINQILIFFLQEMKNL